MPDLNTSLINKNDYDFVYLIEMDVKNKLRNALTQKLQRLPADKLAEIDQLLSKIESQLKSKEATLKLAGSWKEMDDHLFTELTNQLHYNRTNDRQIQL